jgi:hypothetical protein
MAMPSTRGDAGCTPRSPNVRHAPAITRADAAESMPARRTTRILIAACLAIASLVALAPGTTVALDPPRPLPGYRPTFVTETDARPWTDCLWAAGAMLLDKWTNGRRTITHQRLRALSGDRGGSVLTDLAVAYDRLGIKLRYSPDGGDPMTWSGLLRRLAHGAGAVVLGDDSKLPRWYGRWDYRFWKGKGKTDNHAVYVERYDARHGRVWLMDPLGRDDWHGEWISVWSLYRFAWKHGSLVVAAVTPTAKPAPFAHVTTTGLAFSRTPTMLDASWALHAPRRWRYPGTDVKATYSRASDPLRSFVSTPAVAWLRDGGATLKAPRATVAGRTLTARAPLPKSPGAYLAHLRLTDRRFGRTVADTGLVAVFVPGPRRAALDIEPVGRDPADAPATPGLELATRATVRLAITVTNTGTMSWADPPAGLVARGIASARDTRVVARWIQLAGPAGEPVDPDVAVSPVEIGRVPLDPGDATKLTVSLSVPAELGRWALVLDVVDDASGSFAGLGSPPASRVFDVVDWRGMDVVG